jgi:hypothetical protein
VAFTLDTYAHVMPDIQPEAAELFMELVYDDEPDEAARELAAPGEASGTAAPLSCS